MIQYGDIVNGKPVSECPPNADAATRAAWRRFERDSLMAAARSHWLRGDVGLWARDYQAAQRIPASGEG